MSSSRRRRRRHPLGEFGKLPALAPHHACIRCMKGDTERGFIVQGDAEFTAAAIHVYAGLSMDESLGVAKVIFEEKGTDILDRTPVSFIRLCRGCARTTGAPVYSIATLNGGGEFPGLVQDDDE